MSYIDVTDKTEDEALRKGLEQLGMDRDDVSVSILERAKTGFLLSLIHISEPTRRS